MTSSTATRLRDLDRLRDLARDLDRLLALELCTNAEKNDGCALLEEDDTDG